MKILRAEVPIESPVAHVYMNDDRNGLANVTAYQFAEYIKALDIVKKFESEVNAQYQVKWQETP